MTARREIIPPRHDGRKMQGERADSPRLVAVVSDPPQGRAVGGQTRPVRADPAHAQPPGFVTDGVRCIRIAAHAVGDSAAWCRRRSRKIGARALLLEQIGAAPGCAWDLPEDLPKILELLEQDDGPWADHEDTAAAIVALRVADAVIAGPLSPDDAGTPGLLPHLADLAGQAYRALRPPRSLIAHPGFAQVAQRFQYIQMSHQEARALGAGATDIAILALRLRYLQGDPGEFAITAFGKRGLVWADDAWWEIEPIGDEDVDEVVAGAAFCVAWVVARRFRGAAASEALVYARAAAARAVSRVGEE
jgi:hypothetical protein